MNPTPRAYERASGQVSTWTDERVAELVRLWTEGYSASQIARKLGGCTRNAVIGRANRMKLTARRAPSIPGMVTERKTPQRTRADLAKINRQLVQPKKIRVILNQQTFVEAEAREPVRPASMRVFVPLEVCDPVPFGSPGCKWPVSGEGADMMCCGAKQRARPDRDGLSPYCAHHHAIAFVPPKAGQNAKSLVRMARRFA